MGLIKIGFSSENDIVFKDNSISKFHLEAIYHYSDHSCTIHDINSTNGTFVNNRKINKIRIDEKDNLIIGKINVDTVKFINQIKENYYDKETDLSEQYQEILGQLDLFLKEKTKLQKSPLLPTILRVGMSIILVVVLLFFPEFIPNPNLRYVLIVIIGLIPMLVGMSSNNNSKKREKLDLLTLKYEESIKCPKCHCSLLKYTSLYLKKKKKCPNPKCCITYNFIS